MAAIQITPSGIGQTMMIGAVIVGGVLIGDAFFFMADKPSLLAYFNVAVFLDERIRAVAEIAAGILLGMFGLGIWTVQVGGLAIATVLILTLGSYWQVSGTKGSANQRETTASTSKTTTQAANASARRYSCPLLQKDKDWCKEDHDKDGVINMRDSYFNNRGQGIRNCTTGMFTTDHKANAMCVEIK